ncbi:MAG: hypothetical protein R3E31_20565 [Chloroflexota bacterium]
MAVAISPAQLTPALANQIVGQALESSRAAGVSWSTPSSANPTTPFGPPVWSMWKCS